MLLGDRIVHEEQQIPNGVADARELKSEQNDQGAECRKEHVADPRPPSWGSRGCALIRFQHQVRSGQDSATKLPLGLGECNLGLSRLG